ncbi:MAG: macro domain-containing protein [Fimbriimonadia bacterium]|nr:macro domain-containing protein [Fimbriimonadia bacterium]
MIEFVKGNLLEAETEALVNTVNTVGIMGKGIALQFKQAYPKNFQAYRRACESGEVQPGKVFIVPTGLKQPRFIINFPTKRHWRESSRLEDIQTGLKDLIDQVKHFNIRSIALPPLGCGNGGLDWSEVKPLMQQALSELTDIKILIFMPQSGPSANQMKVNSQKPNMTAVRAALIAMMDAYSVPGYEFTKLEAQKLAYFLQTTGEPLHLDFQKHLYGPYAETLNHVLQGMEGHFIQGYGDRKQRSAIRLKPGAATEASLFLQDNPETFYRVERVCDLIENFETPHSLELLATVHWIATKEDCQAREDVQSAIQRLQNWNERKRKEFQPAHIQIAWTRLKEQGWI